MTTNSDRIKILYGDLRAGNTLEVYFDFSCDVLSNFHTNKYWVAYSEKGLKYNSKAKRYYYENNEGTVIEEKGTDYFTIDRTIIGRLFVFFSFTNKKGEVEEYSKIFQIFPTYTLTLPSPLDEGDIKQTTFKTYGIKNTTSNIQFFDNGQILSLSGNSSLSSISREFPYNGFYSVNISADFSNAYYDQDILTPIVWYSTPSDLLVTTGPFGGALAISGATAIDVIKDYYVVKFNLLNSNLIIPEITVGYGDKEPSAPSTVYFRDNSRYYTLVGETKQYYNLDYIAADPKMRFLPLDTGATKIPNPDIDTVKDHPLIADPSFFLSISGAYVGDNRIDYTFIDFGDDHKRKGLLAGFDYQKVYTKSGIIEGTYSVNTIHFLQEITAMGISGSYIDKSYYFNIDTVKYEVYYSSEYDRYYYTDSVSTTFTVNLRSFFHKWFMDLLPNSLYNIKSVQDLASAWGVQMDRVYSDAKNIIESIDVDRINDAFIEHYFNTYGDFQEIAEKIGFQSYTQDNTEIFNFFEDYNFFTRLKDGLATQAEKAEFINYVKNTRSRLSEKGTNFGIQDIFSKFGLLGMIVELWTDKFVPPNKTIYIDEVFNSRKYALNTGLNYSLVLTPSSTNTNMIVVNDDATSFLEINTVNKGLFEFYTDDQEEVNRLSKKYVKFDNLINDAGSSFGPPPVIITPINFDTAFDKWCDSHIYNGSWAISGNEGDGSFGVGLSGNGLLTSEYLNGKYIIDFGDYGVHSMPLGQVVVFGSNVPLISAYAIDKNGVATHLSVGHNNVFRTDIPAISATYEDYWYIPTIPERYGYYYKLTSYRTIGFSGWSGSNSNAFTFISDQPFTVFATKTDPEVVFYQYPNIMPPPTLPDPRIYEEHDFFNMWMVKTWAHHSYWKLTKGFFFINSSYAGYPKINTGAIYSDYKDGNQVIEIGNSGYELSRLVNGKYLYIRTTAPLTDAYILDINENKSYLHYWDGKQYKESFHSTDIQNVSVMPYGPATVNYEERIAEMANIVTFAIQGISGGWKNYTYFYRWKILPIVDNFTYHPTRAFNLVSNTSFSVNFGEI